MGKLTAAAVLIIGSKSKKKSVDVQEKKQEMDGYSQLVEEGYRSMLATVIVVVAALCRSFHPAFPSYPSACHGAY